MKEAFKTSIGGQAVIEGIMMRGPERSALAVRKPDGEIHLEDWANGERKWYAKVPFVRGLFNMGSSLFAGYQCLMRAATIAGMEEEEPSRFELWLSKALGKSLTTIVSVVALVLGAVLAIGLFTVLPAVLIGQLGRWISSAAVLTTLEGITKIGLLILYMALVSKMRDIRRVFEYHGAEHKTIFCYESGLPLTVENIRAQTRFHPRCGTSFLLIVLVISIVLFSVVSWESILLRVLLKLAMLPLVVGIAYEIIKIAGRYDNSITRIISAPGLWLQRLTTKEPDDSQIEIAIASMGPVLPKEQGADVW